MFAASTSYRLCTALNDYRPCHRLLAETGQPKQALAFPTIVAERDGQTVGFISSYTKGGAVCAGPLVITPTIKRPIFVAIRLLDAYEYILREVGITSFLFHIDKSKPTWKAGILKRDIPMYHETATAWWFKRDL